MRTDEKLVYRGVTIACPQCGRKHGLILKSDMPYILQQSEDNKVWIKCPTCNLEFEGVAVGKWNSAKAFEELDKTANSFINTMSKLSSATKTVYTILLLNEIDHSVTRCFRTPVTIKGLDEILKRLSKTCKQGESYLAIEEVK